MLYFELRSKVPFALSEADIQAIFERTDKTFKTGENDRLISIVSVGPREMRKINFATRKKDEATDILSFLLEDRDSFIGAPYVNDFFGEIIICPSFAGRKAKARHMSKTQYLELLLVHGVLHLLGLDHQEDVAAAKMERLEKRILTT